MDSHVHLIIQTKKELLDRLMSRITFMYIKYFNKKYNYNGNLF
ncbi:hypothetical protein [uncultured Clostridium sp.]